MSKIIQLLNRFKRTLVRSVSGAHLAQRSVLLLRLLPRAYARARLGRSPRAAEQRCKALAFLRHSLIQMIRYCYSCGKEFPLVHRLRAFCSYTFKEEFLDFQYEERIAPMPDQTLECTDCREPFTFTEREQAFYATKLDAKTGQPWSAPKRCKPCREAKKQARRSQGN